MSNNLVHSLSQFARRRQSGPQALAAGGPEYHEFALPGLAATVSGAQKCQGLRFASPTAAPVLAREATELDRPRLREARLRKLPRYWATVRLPAFMGRRCSPLGFSMCAAANRRPACRSRTRDLPVHAREGSAPDQGLWPCAGSESASPMSQPWRGFRQVSMASAPRTTQSSGRSAWNSRLNTRHATPFFDASPTSSRVCTHDSGPTVAGQAFNV